MRMISCVALSLHALSGRPLWRRLATAYLASGLVALGLHAQNITIAPVITTVAGNGTEGFFGDGGPATSAELAAPYDVAVDRAGNLYIVDAYNNRIRKVSASTGTITTVAGNGASGYAGDGGAATSAELSEPHAVALDSAGNLYIADSFNDVVRKVSASTGIITTVAGNGAFGHAGDGGAATSAQLAGVNGIAVDSAGNLYIADSSNNRIRKVTASTGIITTVAGDGTAGYSGDGGSATSAELDAPNSVAVDGAGNLYIADTVNEVIRKVSVSTGIITTVAGNGTEGYSGDGGPATSAELATPDAAAVDSAGNLYVVDNSNNRIRKVNASTGIITTVAGSSASTYSGDGGPASSAGLDQPGGVAVDGAGNLYIADTGASSERIRKVNLGPIDFGEVNVGANDTQTVILSIHSALTLSTVQTSGDFSVKSDSCTLPASLSPGTFCTLQVQFAPTLPGQRWFALTAADSGSNNYGFGLEGTGAAPELGFAPGIISTVAGNGTALYSGDGGPATLAEIDQPNDVVVDGAGDLYIADTFNNRVRKVSATGTITTVAGNGTAGYSGDGGAASSAELNQPYSVALDSAGNLYIADSANSRIREVNASTGIITTVAGTGTGDYSGDGGPAISAEINQPNGIAVDGAGDLYIADTSNNCIRKVNALSGIITTVAGNCAGPGGPGGYAGDGGAATSAELNQPYGVAVDGAGDLYIADTQNNVVRKVTASSGIITTVAGNGPTGYSGDGGPATSAGLDGPGSVALDSAGNLYIADTVNNCIREVSVATGIITTIAGNGTGGGNGMGNFSGDGGLATDAGLNQPYGVVLDGMGNLYIADSGNSRIREVNVTTTALSFASTAVGSTSSDSPHTVTVNDIGNLPLDAVSPGLVITGPDFVQVAGSGSPGDCTASYGLAPGVACTLSIRFEPRSAGRLSSSAVFTDNALNTNPSASQTISLSGTATGPQAATPTLSPAGGTYTSAQTVTLRDATSGAILYYTTDGSAPTNASLVYTAPITVNSTETIHAIAMASGYSASAMASATYTINLVAAPAVTLAPTSLTFAAQNSGTTSNAQEVTLTNSGGSALSITSIAASGDFAETNTCGSTVAAGASCAISVTFTPTAGGTRTGSLTITDNASGSPQAVALTGTGSSVTESPTSSSLNISASGGSVTDTIQLAAAGAFSGTVNLTCSVVYQGTGTPTETPTCALNPTSVQVSSGSSVSTTLTVSTTAASARIVDPFLPLGGGAVAAVLIFLGIPRRRWHSLSLLVILGFAIGCLCVGCGGSGGGGTKPSTNPGTTTGSYSVTVTAKSGTLTASTSIPLTVQ